MPTTTAQEEFNDFLAKNTTGLDFSIHPEDRADVAVERALHERDNSDSEEERSHASKIDAAMRMPGFCDSRGTAEVKLPPASFDAGRATGVKGVIADARNYENAKKHMWGEKKRNERRSVVGMTSTSRSARTSSNKSDSDEDSGESDEEQFLRQWRKSRQKELETEDRSRVWNRRTSPSVRTYGRFEEVDALGYLDAIEKVSRDTTVVVFVYDHDSEVCDLTEAAMRPLVAQNPAIRFVKVHYEEIEFDNAGVPAVLGYRNQGDLFANLTALIEILPEEEELDTSSLKNLFQTHHII